jgi:RND family efflux transporter MFP subunit
MRKLPLALLLVGAAAGLAPGAPEDRRAALFAAEVRAVRDVRVPAEVAGRVLQRPVDEHPAVKAGEVVVTLDAALLRAATRAAEAAARRAKARHEYAQVELKRVKLLYEKKSIGEADLDQASVAAREAEAGMHAAEAQAREFETRLDRAAIRAPFPGKLVRIYPETGEYMRVGETAFRIIDDSALKIVLYVPGRMLDSVKPGTVLRLQPEPGGRRMATLEAKVRSVAPAAEGRARTFRVEARASDASGRWRPGMTGVVALGG